MQSQMDREKVYHVADALMILLNDYFEKNHGDYYVIGNNHYLVFDNEELVANPFDVRSFRRSGYSFLDNLVDYEEYRGIIPVTLEVQEYLVNQKGLEIVQKGLEMHNMYASNGRDLFSENISMDVYGRVNLE